MQVAIIGLDIAKHIFQVHGTDARGRMVLRRRLRRHEVVPFFANLAQCTVDWRRAEERTSGHAD
jgi:transposase